MSYKLVAIVSFLFIAQQGNAQLETPFTLDEYFSGTFSSSTWNGTWLTDSTFVYADRSGNYLLYDMFTKKSDVFLESATLANYSPAVISISKDMQYILVRYNVTSIFRHSTTASYALYDKTSNEFYEVHNRSALQLAKFDSNGHGFAYVFENSIYYVSTPSDINEPTLVAKGVPGVIYYGVPDWVYEEEVLGSGSAMWFSPDGTKIAYAMFNDTNVADFSYFVYGKPGVLSDQYPTIATIKYPKVGTPNPVVQTYVYDTSSKISTKFDLISTIENGESNNDYVLYDLSWVSASEVAMISTNRIQNESVIIRCKLDGSCAEETSYQQKNGWLRPKIPKYSADGTRRLEILPQPEGDDYFDHLVSTNVGNNNQIRLTHGHRVVTVIYGWDEVSGLIYYGGSANDTPSQQHIYVVDIANISEDKCLTCSMVVDGENCKYASAAFSTQFSSIVKVCRGPHPIYVTIESLKQAETETIIWQNNAAVRERLAAKLRPTIQDLRVLVDGKFTVRVRMLLPPNLDVKLKHPALVLVYAGPNSNRIDDSFSSGVENYFVTNRRYIYIYIDGRGSGRDGLNKMHQIYRKFGTVEIEDQIAVMKYLQQNCPYIDASNTGIWGWSYGGFASTWALIKDYEGVFKFALAVAPVTNFIYYDTIYTERYMGLPTNEDNLLGYNNTDITRYVEAMRGKLYSIIHGNADDNVHYQQSMLLVKALEWADIPFAQQSYPDENHSLGNVYRHLYHSLDKFFAKGFSPLSPRFAIWR
ncbi:venom dipeptidyl peptidase 4-like isoform X2 [Cylas formicarius]|uniref:venom dipeptidyl peptidase 4-like isoform X2 n=1 Tax=Cylas formicarius TaxID=197179 RepID=UPI00295890E0|nr:venom dipeptidyl peptidase 4-like isoform X2 [Cylas formicarius]